MLRPRDRKMTLIYDKRYVNFKPKHSKAKLHIASWRPLVSKMQPIVFHKQHEIKWISVVPTPKFKRKRT